jgi:hypothetical protein
MSRNARLSLRLFISAVMSVVAIAAIGVSTALAGGVGPPFPH